MSDLSNLKALLLSGDERNIELGLILCQESEEGRKLLRRCREMPTLPLRSFFRRLPPITQESGIQAEIRKSLLLCPQTYSTQLSSHQTDAYAGMLPKLERLTIEANDGLIYFPAELGQSPKLAIIELIAAKHTAAEWIFPFEGSGSFRFKRLILKHLQVASVENEVADWLAAVETLELQHAALPAAIWEKMPNLRTLAVGGKNPALPTRQPLHRLESLTAEIHHPAQLQSWLQACPHLREIAVRTTAPLQLDANWAGLEKISILCLEETAAVSFADELQLPQLRHFSLSNGQFDALGHLAEACPNLEYLSLESCGLATIPASIGQLQQLTYLALIRNSSLKQLPPALGQCRRLEKLMLFTNALEELPDCFDALEALGYLVLDKNELTRLPESLYRWLDADKQHFESFFAYHNPFDPETETRLEQY